MKKPPSPSSEASRRDARGDHPSTAAADQPDAGKRARGDRDTPRRSTEDREHGGISGGHVSRYDDSPQQRDKTEGRDYKGIARGD